LKPLDFPKPVHGIAIEAKKRGDEQKIRDGGCEAYLSKPISVSSFLDTVKKFIG
jgi:two-component system cell cycle response regulator DivK